MKLIDFKYQGSELVLFDNKIYRVIGRYRHLNDFIYILEDLDSQYHSDVSERYITPVQHTTVE